MTLDELDRLAAEQVMGWTLGVDGCIDPNDGYSGCNALYWQTPTICVTCEAWQPTRNIAQAWECLEKVSHLFFISAFARDYCECRIAYRDDKGFGRTAPEAIVRACLKAKGIAV